MTTKDHYQQTFSFGGATIEYRSFNLADVRFVFDEQKFAEDSVRITKVILGGDELEFSSRFGISFATLLKQSANIFALFDVDEVIARALSRNKVTGSALIAIDRTDPSKPRALACAPFAKRFFMLTHLQEFFGRLKGSANLATYKGNGTFTLTYDLSVVHRPIDLQGLKLFPSLNLRVSIDGWGKPTAWLGMQVGKGGAMLCAMADAFRASANIGEDSGKYVAALTRFTRCFSNEDGFGALQTRLDASYLASASLAEFQSFARATEKCELSEKAQKHVTALAYDEAMRFGLTSLDVVSKKRTVRVPSRCSVADIIMMAVEFSNKEATGNVEPLYEWIGRTLSEEAGFDLEGSLEKAVPTKRSYLADDSIEDEEAAKEATAPTAEALDEQVATLIAEDKMRAHDGREALAIQPDDFVSPTENAAASAVHSVTADSLPFDGKTDEVVARAA